MVTSKVVTAPVIRTAAMIPSPAVNLIDPASNHVFKVPLHWQFDTNSINQVITFSLYVGLQPDQLVFDSDTGSTNLFYVFARTNWGMERLERHYFAVSAKSTNEESELSNIVHYPPFPADHVRISWTNTWPVVNLYSTTDLTIPKEQWPIIATVTNSTFIELIITNDTLVLHGFAIDQLDFLTITAFNPNP